MLSNKGLFIALFILLSGLNACTPAVDSTDIKTSGFDTSIDVSASGNNSTTVSVVLFSGGRGVKLKNGDTLSATASGSTKLLSSPTDGMYETTFAFDSSTLFSIKLDRPNDPNATSTVTLPKPFSITAPTSNQLFQSGTNVQFLWSPVASGVLDLSYTTSCIDAANNSVSKSDVISLVDIVAGYTIASANLLPPSGAFDPNITCVCSASLVRKATGTISPALKTGSTISAQQKRNIAFLIQP